MTNFFEIFHCHGPEFATNGVGLVEASKLLKMAAANPAPFGGRVQIKILFQILVHGNEKFQKS